jgi:hypothetical protein
MFNVQHVSTSLFIIEYPICFDEFYILTSAYIQLGRSTAKPCTYAIWISHIFWRTDQLIVEATTSYKSTVYS